MKCPQCGQKHFKKDRFLKIIHAIEPWKLVRDYMAVMMEVSMSMQNDAIENRKGAFIARLHDYKELYFRGLWVGLMATPEEIIHDASGEKPRLTLVKLTKEVCTTVFDEDTKLPVILTGVAKTQPKARNILNSSTHFSALFLLQRGLLSNIEAKHMYDGVLKSIQMEAAHLRYVSGALKAGKKKRDIIHALRILLKKT
jgi:hypothetical protein